eukprot:654562-Hanusia_phi.AAC.2
MDFYVMAGNNHRQEAFHELIQHVSCHVTWGLPLTCRQICEEGLAEVRHVPSESSQKKEEKVSYPSSLQVRLSERWREREVRERGGEVRRS